MSRPLPLVLSALALVIALLGSTPLGEAARSAGIVAFARKAAVANDSARLNGHRSSMTPKAGMIPVVGRNGKLAAALGAVGPQGAQGSAGAAGPAGPAGATGAQGPAGAVAGYTKINSGFGALTNVASGDLLASLSLPAGKYVVFGRVVITADGNVPNFIGSCTLSAGTDSDAVTVGGDGTVVYPSQVDSLMLTHDFAAAGTADLRCSDSSGQPGRWSSAVVTAIPVTSIVKP